MLSCIIFLRSLNSGFKIKFLVTASVLLNIKKSSKEEEEDEKFSISIFTIIINLFPVILRMLIENLDVTFILEG